MGSTESKTTIGVVLGDPSDYIYINSPLKPEELSRLIEDGVVNERQEHRIVGENFPEGAISIIYPGPELTSRGHLRRDRTYQIAGDIAKTIGAIRENVTLDESTQRHLTS